MAQPTRTPKMKTLRLHHEAVGVTLTLLGPISTDSDRRRARADQLFAPVTSLLKTKGGNQLLFGEQPPRRLRVDVGEFLAYKDQGESRFNVLTPDVVDRMFEVDSGWELIR